MSAQDDELARSITGLVRLSKQFGVDLDDEIARLQVEISALNITQQQLETHRNNIQRMMETIQRKVTSRIDDLQSRVDKQRELKETFEQVYGETEIPPVDPTAAADIETVEGEPEEKGAEPPAVEEEPPEE